MGGILSSLPGILGNIAGSSIASISQMLSGGSSALPLLIPEDPLMGNKYNPNEIIGLPPAVNYGSLELSQVLRSMPVVTLTPGWPKFDGGLNLYSFDSNKGIQKYLQILSVLNIKMPTLPLKVAFNADNTISETFHTGYDESAYEDYVQGMSNATLSQARYITGSENASEIPGKLASGLSNTLGNNGGAFPGARRGAGPYINSAGQSIGAGIKKLENGVNQVGGKIGNSLSKVLSGSRIDFPQIWRHSSYSADHQLTIRLINPWPQDDESYMKYIVQPLMWLLALNTPISDSDYTFEWPVLLRAECPGLFQVKAGYISTLSVLKGGAQGHDIGLTQRSNEIEVQITISDVYSTLIAKTNSTVNEDRPTLDRYMSVLMGKMDVPEIDTSDYVSLSDPNSVTINMAPLLTPSGIFQNIQNVAQELAGVGVDVINPRITVFDEETASNPIVNSTQLSSLLSGTGLDINSSASISKISKETQLATLIRYYDPYYSNAIDEDYPKLTKFGAAQTIALKIKLGINVPNYVLNWYYQNYTANNADNSLSIIEQGPPLITATDNLNPVDSY